VNRILCLAVAATFVAGPLLAQTTTAPAASSDALVPAAGNPNLSVASVRMQNGHRASKIIGAGVYSDANTQIGTVDDLMITPDQKVALAILSVGGFIGLGGKLVAVPIGQLQQGADGKLMLAGATKDSLNAQPNFVY
jgi:hypothetical protein